MLPDLLRLPNTWLASTEECRYCWVSFGRIRFATTAPKRWELERSIYRAPEGSVIAILTWQEEIMIEIQGNKKRSSIMQVALASWIGTSIEWYDFFLYGTAAALVLGPLFFSPNFSPLAAQLSAFATFWVGFAFRPIGGIIFGHFGDRAGRKTMLILTLLIMGFATFLVGCLPTYSSIGIWAPICLVVLRMLQGIAVGGEWGGAVLMATEHSPDHRRGFYGSWPQMGVPTGLLLSSLLFSLISTSFSKQAFLAFGWRIPFLLSIVLVVVGLFIRLSIAETPDFERLKAERAVVRMPIIDVLRHWRNFKYVLLAAGAFIVVNGSFYIYITFSVTYGTTVLNVPANVILNGTLIAAAVLFFGLPLAGALSDRFGRLPIYLLGAALTILLAFPVFWLIDTRSPVLIALGLTLGQLANGLMYGPQAAFYSELFETQIRYSGASLGYQGASIVAGGLAPFIATALLGIFGHVSWPISVYIIIMGIITFVSAYLAGETRHRSVVVEASAVSPAEM
jgi:MHS family shikimate/dehydroshikimate transporter-like MFS transporter